MTFVLVGSNIVISALRKVIPDKVHLPCYIVIIAGFVTIVQMFMQAYMESLYNALGAVSYTHLPHRERAVAGLRLRAQDQRKGQAARCLLYTSRCV